MNELLEIEKHYLLKPYYDFAGDLQVEIIMPEIYVDKTLLQHLRFPLLQGVVNELSQEYDVEVDFVWAMVIAVVALVLQGIIDIEHPLIEGSRVPASLFVILLAITNERKSTLLKLLWRPVKSFEKSFVKEYEEALNQYKIDCADWNDEIRHLKNEIKRFRKKGVDTSTLKKISDELQKNLPTMPRKVRLVYENVTTEAYASALQNDFPSAGIFTTETTNTKNSSLTRDPGFHNALWSGDPTSKDTKTAGSTSLDDVRSTFFTAHHLGSFERLLEKNGAELFDTNLIGRIMIFHPESRVGGRDIKPVKKDLPCLKQFHQRLDVLLEENLKLLEEGFERELVPFSRDAKVYFQNVSQQIEYEQAPDGLYKNASHHLSKLPENYFRLAGSFHKFEKFNGPVSVESLEDVIHLSNASTAAYMKRFLKAPQVVEDAKSVFNYYSKQMRQEGERLMERNLGRSNVTPEAVRRNPRYENAIEYLCRIGLMAVWKEEYKDVYKEVPKVPKYDGDTTVEIIKMPKKKGKALVDIHPGFPQPIFPDKWLHRIM